jgi:hypothetical protein
MERALKVQRGATVAVGASSRHPWHGGDGMSDNYLRLIPSDPRWRPSERPAQDAATLLSRYRPDADRCSAEFCEEVTFFDAGAKTESITCPFCRTNLGDWWGDAMGRAYRSKFADLTIKTPCCDSETSLNDLTYVWPAAFGSFALEAANPGRPSLSEAERLELERTLGSPLKLVWQHV